MEVKKKEDSRLWKTFMTLSTRGDDGIIVLFYCYMYFEIVVSASFILKKKIQWHFKIGLATLHPCILQAAHGHLHNVKIRSRYGHSTTRKQEWDHQLLGKLCWEPSCTQQSHLSRVLHWHQHSEVLSQRTATLLTKYWSDGRNALLIAFTHTHTL
eukprot:scpid36673/ scgid28645/ 